MCVSIGSLRGYNRDLDFHMIVSCPTWVLGTKLMLSRRVASTFQQLSHPSSPLAYFFFCSLCSVESTGTPEKHPLYPKSRKYCDSTSLDSPNSHYLHSPPISRAWEIEEAMYTSHSTSHFHSLLFMPSLGTLLRCSKMAWWIALNETWQAWSETKYTYRSQREISVGKGICPWELDDLIFLESIEGEDQLLIDASCLQNICGLHEPAWDCMHHHTPRYY